MPKVEKLKLAPKNPSKPYIRSTTKLQNLRDLQVIPTAMAKPDTKSSTLPIDTSTSSMESIESPSNKDLMTLLKSMKNQQCTKDDLSKLEATVTNKIDEVKTTAENNTRKILSLTKRLDKFENSANASSHDSELQKQRLLKNNICVMGIPPIPNEIPINTAVKTFEVLECTIASSDIASAYRTRGNSPLLVVKLANYEDKIKLLNAKAKKMVKVSDVAVCDPSVANNYVYINNHVTPYFGKLLKEGRAAIKNKQLFACWLSSTGCVVKFEEQGDVIGFNTVKELQKIINDRPSSSQAPPAATAAKATKRSRKSDAEQLNGNKSKHGRTDKTK